MLTEDCLSLSFPEVEWIGSLSCDDSPLLGARMDDCGNPDCVHIVARFIDVHIISILLGCYTCGMAMAFGIRVRLMGWVFVRVESELSLLHCIVVWCLSFVDVHSVES